MDPYLPDDVFAEHNARIWAASDQGRSRVWAAAQRLLPPGWSHAFYSTEEVAQHLEHRFGWRDDPPGLPPCTALWPLDDTPSLLLE